MTSKKKPPRYWESFSNLERELLTFIEECGTVSVMPTYGEFNKARRSDLVKAIRKHGGIPAVAEKLGLTYKAKRHGYWDKFTLERELLAFIEKHGIPGVMPTNPELIKAGRGDLARTIQRCGGFPTVAENLGLNYAKTRPGHWQDFVKVEQEILAFIKQCGTPGVMPTYEALKKAGRNNLVQAIQTHHGGRQAVAERLGLQLIYTAKPPNYWKEYTNV